MWKTYLDISWPSSASEWFCTKQICNIKGKKTRGGRWDWGKNLLDEPRKTSKRRQLVFAALPYWLLPRTHDHRWRLEHRSGSWKSFAFWLIPLFTMTVCYNAFIPEDAAPTHWPSSFPSSWIKSQDTWTQGQLLPQLIGRKLPFSSR